MPKTTTSIIKKTLTMRGLEPITHQQLVQNTRDGEWLNSARFGKLSQRFKDLAGDLNLNKCPTDYETLLVQAQISSGFSNYFLVVLGQRLVHIRDSRLYEQNGYSSFNKFLTAEIKIGHSTAYRYMSIYSHFGALLAGDAAQDVDYTKLLPVLPLLNADDKQIPKDKIKRDFLERVNDSSTAEINAAADELKAQYGVSKPTAKPRDLLTAAIEQLIKKLPAQPNSKQRQQLKGLHQRIGQLIDIS